MATKISFYFDEHMHRAVAQGLIARQIQVVMAVDADMEGMDDDEHLRYATAQHSVLVTRDKPFAGRAMLQTNHAGLVCWTGAQDDIGGMIRQLSEFAQNHDTEAVQGQVFWLK